MEYIYKYKCGCEQTGSGRFLYQNPECNIILESHNICLKINGILERLENIEDKLGIEKPYSKRIY